MSVLSAFLHPITTTEEKEVVRGRCKKLIYGASLDEETLAAYYCFVNLGWPPSQFDSLPSKEKQLVVAFAFRDMVSRKKEQEKLAKR